MGLDPYAGCNLLIAKEQCTLETCCLAQSSFLYRPDRAGNIFYVVLFSIFIIPQLGLGIKYKSWGYMAGLVLGLALEGLGYGARVWLHDNPFSTNAFLIYLIALTIAPVFITAAIYLCLSRIIILYGEDLSILHPRTIAVSFVASDFVTLVLQAVGGVWAQAASQKGDSTKPGVNVMIAGLLLMVLSLVAFLAVSGLFAFRARTGMTDQSPGKFCTRRRPLFLAFLLGLLLATILILIRSIYRVAELWDGFAGHLWNNEVDFMVLDGAMMGAAVILLTALHPGPAFREQWSLCGWSLRGRIDDMVELTSTASSMPLGPEKEMIALWKHDPDWFEKL